MGWEASAAIVAVVLWGHWPEVSAALHPPQGRHQLLYRPNESWRLFVACELRAPCSHALDAEWKSFVSHDRYFSHILSIREG